MSMRFNGILFFVVIGLVTACGGGGGGGGSSAGGGNGTTYTIGGAVRGLESGKSLVLQNNSGDNLTVSADGAFVFTTPIADGSTYSVSISTPPTDQNCSSTFGAGTVGGANVANVNVFCGPVNNSAASSVETTNALAVREYHTATQLSDGTVLVVGGVNGSGTFLDTSAIYNPADLSWTAVGALTQGVRASHRATLLNDGTVLVTGGWNNSGTVYKTAELYDPTAKTWSKTTNDMGVTRFWHAATLLSNGKVLVTGGYDTGGFAPVNNAEVYNPADQTWTATTGDMNSKRALHTATLLDNGKVLVAGGDKGSASTTTGADLYDPGTNAWTATGAMLSSREYHTATKLANGKVLVAGGDGFDGMTASYWLTTELYDPNDGSWSPAATNILSSPRSAATATLLASGKVAVMAGFNQATALKTVDVYDPSTLAWSSATALNTARSFHTATLLDSGSVLVAGGDTASGGGASAVNSVELYSPGGSSGGVIWSSAASLSIERKETTATLLPNGKVLVAGGRNLTSVTGQPGDALDSAELYDSGANSWIATGSMNVKRFLHEATLLTNGKVLVAGGFDDTFAGTLSADLYDPDAETWTSTGAMGVARIRFTATLLPNGKVLVAGGIDPSDSTFTGFASAELYDPTTGVWAPTGSMTVKHWRHTATLLPNGKVLVAGGYSIGYTTAINTAELYDPATGTWTATSTMNEPHTVHFATLLPNGKVLLAGGPFTAIGSELYDPATGFWSAAGPMNSVGAPPAMLLPSGKVLALGASGSTEIFNPDTNTWAVTGSLTTSPRNSPSATLLANGKLMLVGGDGLNSYSLGTAELGW